MTGLDTNVLVRYLTEDDAEQAARAAKLLEAARAPDARLFVSHVVLCELVWVLTGAYRRKRKEVVAVLRGLLAAAQLVVEDAEVARRALDRFERGAADFADYVIAERAASAGCETVSTFDRRCLRERGFVAL